MNDRAKIVDFYLRKIEEEEFEIDSIRNELGKAGIDHEEIRIIFRIIDNEVQKRMLTKTVGKKANTLVWVGLTLCCAGLFFTIGTYTGLLPMGNSFLFAYGPILGGLSILAMGLAKKVK